MEKKKNTIAPKKRKFQEILRKQAYNINLNKRFYNLLYLWDQSYVKIVIRKMLELQIILQTIDIVSDY